MSCMGSHDQPYTIEFQETPAEEGELVNLNALILVILILLHKLILSIVQQIIDDKGMNQEFTRG